MAAIRVISSSSAGSMTAQIKQLFEAEERAKKAREELESSVRLALVELDELQGLPLPSQ